jgi:hypothetical protein
MSNPEFDWTAILPEDERKKVLAERQPFFDSFPTKDEVEQAGLEGRAAFANACDTVDARKETERLLNAAADHIAGTLEQPSDPRAWDQLLIYCPREAIERRLAASPGPLSKGEDFRTWWSRGGLSRS